MEITATRLRRGWALRPKGCLGTCGEVNGKLWTVKYVSNKPAHIKEEA
jgi:hypothetical protein